MIYFDDGVVGLSVERRGATLRLLERPAKGGKPDYVAVAHIQRWTEDAASISGLLGSVSMRHQALIVKVLHGLGIRWLFSERSFGRTGMAHRVDYMPLRGWFITDIDEAVKRASARYPKIHDVGQ
ncbi:MAG: hypothetical protein RL758_278 [Pseudomonadota bacterium]